MTRFFVLAFAVASLAVLTLALIPSPTIPGNPNDKFLHALAFAVLSVLAALAFPRAQLRYLALLLAVFAGAIEVIQLVMNQGRVAEWYDFWASAAAAVAALFFVNVIRRAVAAASA